MNRQVKAHFTCLNFCESSWHPGALRVAFSKKIACCCCDGANRTTVHECWVSRRLPGISSWVFHKVVESDAVFGPPEPDKCLDEGELLKHFDFEDMECWILSLI
jgi:hypothetical protein